jgi:hypothetical protein
MLEWFQQLVISNHSHSNYCCNNANPLLVVQGTKPTEIFIVWDLDNGLKNSTGRLLHLVTVAPTWLL